MLAPPLEGSLAPDPSRITPPPGRVAPLRELPGFRKKDKTWKDEVRERMRERKRRRGAAAELPLFPEAAAPASSDAVEEPPEPPEPVCVPEETPEPVGAPRSMELGDALISDLPLRPLEDSRSAEPAAPDEPVRELDLDAPAQGPASLEWSVEFAPPRSPATRPIERPAQASERARAGAVDFLLLLVLWTVVVYFSGRAARVGLLGLLPAWPWIAGYLACLGLVYATCFTGTTGQTLGKLLFGLRVVDTAGDPPGHGRAFLRAVLGSLGSALLFVGFIPMLVDPARRALHDRLLKTRVVRR
jgi:uncharacterized RDD family membrane protein YckC